MRLFFLITMSFSLIFTFSGCSDKKAKPTNNENKETSVTISKLITYFKKEGLKVESASMTKREKKFVDDAKKSMEALNKSWGVKHNGKRLSHVEYSSLKIDGIIVRIKRYFSSAAAKKKYDKLCAVNVNTKSTRKQFYRIHGPFIMTVRNYSVRLSDAGTMVPTSIDLDQNILDNIWKVFDSFPVD